MVPLAHSERKFFVIKYRGVFLVFTRTAQGSRGAPLTWAAVASLLARVSQSLFVGKGKQCARLQVYVDDPILGMQGSAIERRRMTVKFICVFLTLGVRLAFDKAQLGTTVVWVGVELKLVDWSIVAAVTMEKLEALLEIILEMLSANVISVKALRSLAGKATNVATLVPVWRPFLNQMWAALSALENGTSNAPANCVWTKQVESSLLWLVAFISGQSGSVSRTFDFKHCCGQSIPVEITTDASIYGYGGWLSVGGKPVAWFSETISPTDEEVLGHKAGNHEGQQAFEAMALLIAVRVWFRFWKNRRFRLALRNDNIGALTVFSALKGRSVPMNAVAREYALELAEGSFEPTLVQHIPGITNVVADLLSRKTDPKHASSWKLPQFLVNATETKIPQRGFDWWRARLAPGVATREVMWGSQT